MFKVTNFTRSYRQELGIGFVLTETPEGFNKKKEKD